MSFLQKFMDHYFPNKQDQDEAFSTSKKKGKYGIYLLLVIGMLFLLFGNGLLSGNAPPKKENTEDLSQEAYVQKLEERLAQSISQIDGVGKVKVMITLKASKEIVLAEEIKSKEQSTNEGTKTNLLSDRESKLMTINNQPLIVKELEPKLEGVMVVAEGAFDAGIKEKINIAAKTLLGVEPHKIAVFQLKKGR